MTHFFDQLMVWQIHLYYNAIHPQDLPYAKRTGSFHETHSLGLVAVLQTDQPSETPAVLGVDRFAAARRNSPSESLTTHRELVRPMRVRADSVLGLIGLLSDSHRSVSVRALRRLNA